MKQSDQSTIFSFTLLIIPLSVLCCLFLLCVRVIHILIKNKDSPKNEVPKKGDETGPEDAEQFSMTIFNNGNGEDRQNQGACNTLENITELKEEEEEQNVIAFKDSDDLKPVVDETMILRKSLRKGEGGMYFEEDLV